MGKKFAIHTLGCRVNAYESEAMKKALIDAGWTEAPFAPGADAYIINTCTVTHVADQKSRQMLHRAKKLNPAAVVCAVGCYVEDSFEEAVKDPAVDIAVGNHDKARIAEILSQFIYENESGEGAPSKNAMTLAACSVKGYEELPHADGGDRTRAFLKIQDGCNQFCTYCMIPYVRGRARSRALESIVEEAKGAAARGIKEIVLTGIHLSSYGRELDNPGRNLPTPFADRAETNFRLLEAIRQTAAVEGIERVRMGSLEPGSITEEFAAALAAVPEFCPSFHLSLQSGCDATLKRMNRRYTAGQYLEKCGILRAAFENPAISTDIIAGFPGETEEEFEKTAAFVREVGFMHIHAFKYSPRKGTKAAAMPDQVPEDVKNARAAVLAAIDEEAGGAYASSFIGKEEEVLVERVSREGGCCVAEGYTRRYVRARVKAEAALENDILQAAFTGVSGRVLLGETPKAGV